MSIDGPDKMTSIASPGRPQGGYLGLLRTMARIAVVTGAVGSVGLMLRAGRRTPRLLLVLFVIWVLSPFVAIAWANMVSKRWSVLTRATLYCVTLVLTLGSLAIYGDLVLPPAGSPRAFVFVVVPPVSWVLLTIVVPTAHGIDSVRKHSQRRYRQHRIASVHIICRRAAAGRFTMGRAQHRTTALSRSRPAVC